MTAERPPLPTRISDTPPLPEAFGATLDSGLRQLGLADLPPAAREALEGHARLLLAWTAAINLTAIRDPAAVARGHVLDSLAAVPLLRALGVVELVDLGSGGGYPGLPLAVALPAERILLVESTRKKAAFLATVVLALGLEGRVAVAAERAEDLARRPEHDGRWQAVCARAVADLGRLVRYAAPLLAPGGVLVAWKRVPLVQELDEAGPILDELGCRVERVAPVAVDGLLDHRLVVVRRETG